MPRPVRPRLEAVPPEGAPPRVDVRPSEALTLGRAFRLFAPYVARIGIRILGRDDEEIDDLIQDVFTEAAAGLRELRGPEAVKGWLSTVTVRVAVRRLRVRRLRRFVLLDDADDPVEPVWPGASPEQCALIARIYALLARLPANEHAAWVLRHVEGQSLEEVAEIAECSLATAKRRIAAAERWIDRKLGHESAR